MGFRHPTSVLGMYVSIFGPHDKRMSQTARGIFDIDNRWLQVVRYKTASFHCTPSQATNLQNSRVTIRQQAQIDRITMSYSWNTTAQQVAEKLRTQIEGKVGAWPSFRMPGLPLLYSV